MVDLWGPIQAILAIPSALQAVRDLAQGGNNHDELEKQIATIEVSLKKFSETGEWFAEAKEYHERLTHLAFGMGELIEAVSLPRHEGGFNPDRFSIQQVTTNWRKIRNLLLVPVIVFLEDAKYFAMPDSSRAGELMKEGTFEYIQDDIEYQLRDYDQRSAEKKEKICLAIDGLEDCTRKEILKSDRILIDRALEIAQCLGRLRDSLQ